MMVPFVADNQARQVDSSLRCIGRKGYSCIAGGPVWPPLLG